MIPTPKRSGGVRSAASQWVAGVGAALLIVSAALFVAVQWDHVPDVGKLGIILAVTTSFVFGGRHLKRTLPATGGVLFHLGAFLLPMDLAAVNLRIGMSWHQLLLAEGVLGIVAFFGLGLIEESRVLRAAASLAVIATALGIGANTPIPAPVALGLAAFGMALAFPRSQSASVWAAVAGYLPVLALPFVHVQVLNVLLGSDPLGIAIGGVLGAAVLGFAAHIERDVRRAFIAIGALVVSGTTAYAGAGLPRVADLYAPVGAFVVIELVSYALRRDVFWSRPIGVVRLTAEVVAIFATLGALFADHTPVNVARAAFLAIGWGIATLSCDGWRARLSLIATASAALASVQVATTNPWVLGGAILLFAGVLVEVRDRFTDVAAVVMLMRVDPRLGLLFGVLSAALLVRRARGSSDRIDRAMLTSGAILALAFGSFASHIDLFYGAMAFAAGCWAMSVAIESDELEVLPRAAMLGAIVPSLVLAPAPRFAVVGIIFVAFAVDAIRRDEPALSYGCIVPSLVAIFSIGEIAHLPFAYIGVVSCIAAIVYAGLSVLVDARWRTPLQVTAVVSLAVGALTASYDAGAFGLALMIAGAITVALAIAEGKLSLGWIGGALIACGAVTELAAQRVGAAEAYMAPVAVYLIVMGTIIRRTKPVSSWQAYAPAVAMFGGVALIERIVGGPGWHSVVAGATAVAAIAIGGTRRLAGPLFAGTALLASVVGFESIAVAATVPTWAWLALGGSVLLGTGIVLERGETTPLQAGRRVVDVIATNFS